MDAQPKDSQDYQDLDPEIPALTDYAAWIIQQHNKDMYTKLWTVALSWKVKIVTTGYG